MAGTQAPATDEERGLALVAACRVCVPAVNALGAQYAAAVNQLIAQEEEARGLLQGSQYNAPQWREHFRRQLADPLRYDPRTNTFSMPELPLEEMTP